MHIYEYEILVKLAKNNDLFAIRRILDYYFENRNSENIRVEEIEIDKQQIIKYLKLLIENDDSNAMLVLGALHYTGEDGIAEQDYSKAEYFYNKAINMKPINYNYNTTALNNLGYVYFYGKNNVQDYSKAFLYFGKAACLQNSNAMYKIGDMYKNGIYVRKNIQKAFYWYKEAFLYTQNDDYCTASVSLRLGEAYLYRKGTDIDLLKSLKYLQIAERRYYKMAINKPILSNAIYVDGPLKNVQKILDILHKKLNKLI